MIVKRYHIVIFFLIANFIFADPPSWDVNGDGVLDNYNDYENNGSVTVMVSVDGSTSFGESGDMIACFVDGEQRGVGLSGLVPFGPYQGTYQFQMMIYSNAPDGEMLTFQYYSQLSDAVYNLNESLEFTINMTEGTVISPYTLTFNPGDDIPDPIYGCTDDSACNYNIEATNDDGSCDYPLEFYDCSDECLSDIDGDDICDELEILGCTNSDALNYDLEATDDDGSCLIIGCTDINACNYNPDATGDDDSCIYSEENFDCDGNCTENVDCNGVCGGDSYEDECGICDNVPPNDCVQDCAGEWGGDAEIDECGICDNDFSNNCIQDCAGEWGGDAIIDECDICDGADLNNNGYCDPECPDNYILNPQFPNVNDNSVCIPELFTYNISTVSAGYLFYQVTINGVPIDNNDWVGAFNGEICVGSQIWDTNECSNNVCSISVMGYDNDSFTEGYMLYGDIPTFRIYDSSENIYYDAYPTDDIEWENFGFSDINLLSTQVQGCTDDSACNFDLEATEDNGSCEYPEENYDCDGNCIVIIDCEGECGGFVEFDECGECGGDNSTCTGCTDLEALNYDETALINDGSCVFDFDLPPELFEFNQSTQQAFYFFEIVSINNILLDNNDWVAAFNGDICVGSKKWDTSLCGEGVCDLPIMGNDNESYSEGYMDEGGIPTFKIYDYSEQQFYNAISSNDIGWENNGTFVLDYLNVFPDCFGELGGDALIDDCGDCSSPDNFNSGQDDCGVCYGNNEDQDCAGLCFGDALIDDCGDCDGNNASCSGCTDPNALNYDNTAIIDDGSCSYTLPVSMNLHQGANLVSFYALPENLEFETFISPLFNSISGVITEGSAATLLNDQWLGSILSMDSSNGYWFVMEEDDDLEFDGYPLDNNYEYSLHTGPNLISFPSSEAYLLEDILPNNLEGVVYGIISEGASAYYLDGNWIGLEYLEGGKGYWFKSYEDISFSFEIDVNESIVARSSDYNDQVLDRFEYIQSSEQAFYYFDNIEDAVIGDWIIAYNDNNIVGTKKWEGDITDIAIMGYINEEYDFSDKYCKIGDVPSFTLYKHETGEEIILSGNIKPWMSNDISYIGTLFVDETEMPNNFGLSSIYPNPFNPTTTIDFYVPENMEFSLSLFDLQGRLVENIINQNSVGYYSIEYSANSLSSGIYFIQLKTSSFIDNSKIILLK